MHPWRSHPAASLAHKRTPQENRISNTVLHNSGQVVDPNVCRNTDYDDVKIAGQAVLQPSTQQIVLVTTKSHGRLNIPPNAMPISRNHTLLARRTMRTSPSQPFRILVSDFAHRQIHLPKRMVITQCKAHPDVI